MSDVTYPGELDLSPASTLTYLDRVEEKLDALPDSEKPAKYVFKVDIPVMRARIQKVGDSDLPDFSDVAWIGAWLAHDPSPDDLQVVRMMVEGVVATTGSFLALLLWEGLEQIRDAEDSEMEVDDGVIAAGKRISPLPAPEGTITPDEEGRARRARLANFRTAECARDFRTVAEYIGTEGSPALDVLERNRLNESVARDFYAFAKMCEAVAAHPEEMDPAEE